MQELGHAWSRHKHIPHIIACPGEESGALRVSCRQPRIDLGNPCSEDDTTSLEIPKYPAGWHWGRWQEPYLACCREGRNSWVSQHLFLPAGNQTGMALAIGWSLQRSRARMGQGCFEGSSSFKNPGDKFPFLLFWGRNPPKILILHLGRREIKGRGWTLPWCVC